MSKRFLITSLVTSPSSITLKGNLNPCNIKLKCLNSIYTGFRDYSGLIFPLRSNFEPPVRFLGWANSRHNVSAACITLGPHTAPLHPLD